MSRPTEDPTTAPHSGTVAEWASAGSAGLGRRPRLIVLVATEEEFDWSADLRRDNPQVRAAGRLPGFQRTLDSNEIHALYLCDFPIATHAESRSAVKQVLGSRNAELGAHLHPWVTPPHEESLSRANSFPGNLDPDLEYRKLAELSRALEQGFDRRPFAYQAGRYGFGPHTARSLARLGFELDLSPSPGFDYTAEGGPDWTAGPIRPKWHAEVEGLLVVPTTGGLIGWGTALASPVYRLASQRWLAWARLRGVLARAGAIERIRLSPEGFELGDLQRLTRHLAARGVDVFTLSLHSPSLAPGCTPYVQSEADAAKLIDTLLRYVEFFRLDMRGITSSARDILDAYQSARGQAR